MLEECSVHENAPLFDLQILNNCGSLCGASFFSAFNKSWHLPELQWVFCCEFLGML